MVESMGGTSIAGAECGGEGSLYHAAIAKASLSLRAKRMAGMRRTHW